MQIDDFPNSKFGNGVQHLHPEHLIKFGRIGYITTRKQIKKKWTDKSVKCVMVGYANNHLGDTYWTYDPMTGCVRITRDVIWSEWKRVDPKETMKVFKERKDLGFENTVGVDEPTDKDKISNDKYDNDKMENNPQAIIANNVAQAGRNVVQNLTEVGRVILDATGTAVGRIAHATTNATTTTEMSPSNESTKRAQFRRPKTLLRELKALQPAKPTEETEVVAVNEEEQTKVEMDID